MSLVPTRNTESTSYRKLWATCMARLPGIGSDALKLEIGNAMQEFARSTHCWREQISLNLVGGQSVYQITPLDNCADVTYVISLSVNDRPYRPITPEAFDNEHLFTSYRVLPGNNEVELFPTPSGDTPKGLQVWVGLVPKPDSLDLPDTLIDHYFENIIDGVLERAYFHPSKPYSDPKKQEYHHRRFRAAITRTRREIRGGSAQADPAWHFNTQAPGRSRRGARSYGW